MTIAVDLDEIAVLLEKAAERTRAARKLLADLDAAQDARRLESVRASGRRPYTKGQRLP